MSSAPGAVVKTEHGVCLRKTDPICCTCRSICTGN